MLRVIYLVFNEGYAASSGASLTRHDLSAEAIRLGRLLVELLPEPEARGLLALMLLHESRRAARTSPSGELILLDEQDRSLLEPRVRSRRARASSSRRSRRAAARPVHDSGGDRRRARRGARPPAATDWAEIVGLYDVLLRVDPSPVVELNRAVAVAMRDGPAAGLALIDAILDARRSRSTTTSRTRRAPSCAGGSDRSHRGASLVRRALELTRQEPERRFLERRLAEL